MEKYNYHDAICKDIRAYIEDNEIEVNKDTKEDVIGKLEDELINEDSVTGNASGSYTFSNWQAEENICHNTDLARDALRQFGVETIPSAETLDVIIRCYLLYDCIYTTIAEILEENTK